MPSLLGFQKTGEKIEAVIDFPNARRFTLTPGEGGQPVMSVIHQPRRAAYDLEGAQLMVQRCLEEGKDSSFWSDTAKWTGERQEQLDHIKTHGASDYRGKFMLAAYQSDAPEQIILPSLARKPDAGLNH